MQSDLLIMLRRLSDAELEARVKDLVAGERGGMVLVVAHLSELDTRDVHLRAGHGSLYAYCRDALALSEQEAYNRIAVARAARRYPGILPMLEDGSLNLTTARLLVPHLTPDNHEAVLEKARGKTKAQVEELAAALWPRPDAPSFVRKLPAPRTDPPLPPSATPAVPAVPSFVDPTLEAPCSGSPPASNSSVPGWQTQAGSPTLPSGDAAASTPRFDVDSPVPPPTPPRSQVTPLSPDRYRVQLTIGAETLAKLRLAKDLLRHAVPSADEAVILDRALTALISDLERRRFAAVATPRAPNAPRPGSRSIPAEVKRRVWLRDQGRCAFVAATGHRCAERAFLEFHHLQPYALGGEATLANIQLRCRSHNAYEARLLFGAGASGAGHGRGNGGAGSVREPAARYSAW